MRWAAVVAVGFLAAGCKPSAPGLAVENPITVESVQIEGFDVLPVDARESLERALPLRAGTVLTNEREQAAGERAVQILQNHGYPYGQVSLERVPIDSTHARVVLRAQPGTLGYFGAIDIAGNRRVDDVIIRRRLAYAPGDLFRRSAIERTQQRIGALGLFKSVEIRAGSAAASGATGAPGSVIDTQPAEVPTLITVVEQSPWQWNLSASYAAGERLGFDARVSNLNFLGAARRLDLQGRVSRIEKTLEVAFTQSEAWHPALSLSLQARHQEIDEQSFFVMSRGGQAAVGWRWTPAFVTTLSYAAAFERSDVDEDLDVLLGLQDGMLNAWSIDLDHRRVPGERRADLVVADIDAPPTQTVSAHIEQAGGWMPGTFNYFNVIGDVRHYRRAFDDRVMFASRLRYGAIEPFGTEADIPLLKRFFLGGSNEMRGWGIYEVSPLSASGEPVGGKSMVTATGEVRFRLLPRLSGAFFVEAGNVWQDSWAVHLDDLLYDLGPGLRLQTPFGLIRVDFGYQLKTLEGLRIEGQPQKSRWRFNMGIGEAF
jgi:outer membrane protein assembly factor BamA